MITCLFIAGLAIIGIIAIIGMKATGALQMEEWFKTLTIKELSTWVKNFDNSTLNQFLDNQPNEKDLKTAKRILKNKLDNK